MCQNLRLGSARVSSGTVRQCLLWQRRFENLLIVLYFASFDVFKCNLCSIPLIFIRRLHDIIINPDRDNCQGTMSNCNDLQILKGFIFYDKYFIFLLIYNHKKSTNIEDCVAIFICSIVGTVAIVFFFSKKINTLRRVNNKTASATTIQSSYRHHLFHNYQVFTT